MTPRLTLGLKVNISFLMGLVVGVGLPYHQQTSEQFRSCFQPAV